MIAKYNDGGRSESAQHSKEHFDCGVRAIAIALNMPYDDVHRTFRRHGRSFQDGVTTKQVERVLEDLCPTAKKTYVPVQLNIGEIGHKWTTQRLIKIYENDVIIMDTFVEWKGERFPHLCTVIKGVVHDQFIPYGQVVKRIYLISDASENKQ